MEENKIANVTETAGKPAVWESVPFFSESKPFIFGLLCVLPL